MGYGGANHRGLRGCYSNDDLGQDIGLHRHHPRNRHGALPSGILAASFSDQLRSSRKSLQASVNEALEDGILTQDEIGRLRRMGNDMGLRPETLDELIKSTARLKANQHHQPVVMPHPFAIACS